MGKVNFGEEGETDESEELIPGRYEEKVFAEGMIQAALTTRGWMIDAWLTGKLPTMRFVIAELGDDGLMHARAGSDEKDDDGPSASGKNYLEALDALEKKLAERFESDLAKPWSCLHCKHLNVGTDTQCHHCKWAR